MTAESTEPTAPTAISHRRAALCLVGVAVVFALSVVLIASAPSKVVTTTAWVAIGFSWAGLVFMVVASKLPPVTKKGSRIWVGLGLFMLASGALSSWRTFSDDGVWRGLADLAVSAPLVPFALCLAFLAPRASGTSPDE